MSQTVRLSILLVGLLLAFPFLYPLSRSFFHGDAPTVRPEWSPATEYVPTCERTRRRPALKLLMTARGQLKDVALTDDGTLVLIDQRDKPLVYGK